MYYSIPQRWTQSVGQWHNPRIWRSVVVLAMVRLWSQLPKLLRASCDWHRRLRLVRTVGWLSLHTTSFCELRTATSAVVHCKTWRGKLWDAIRATDYYLCTQRVLRHAWSITVVFKTYSVIILTPSTQISLTESISASVDTNYAHQVRNVN